MEFIIRNSKQLGNAIRNIRVLKKLTQIDIAKKTAKRQATISSVELGSGGVKIDTLFDILAAQDLEIVIRERKKGSIKDYEDIF